MSLFSSLTCEQLQKNLESALSAQHNLMMGRQVAEVVDQNGERVKFNAASLPRLTLYIQQLQFAMAQKGCGGVGGMCSGPLEFLF